MLKHIVMWKLRESAEGAGKLENARIMKAELEGLKGKIKEIMRVEVGVNTNGSPDAYDVVLYSEFADKAALNAYAGHPAHLKAADFIGKIRLERKVVDYEV